MSFTAAILAEQLTSLEETAGRPARFVIAFSGGLDSTVLVHALAELKQQVALQADIPLLALHVDHDLQPTSADWSEHCAQTVAALNIEYRALRVDVQLDSGNGPEASARDARYSALCAKMRDDDWLLTAHHLSDQAETVLINLIRGSGPAGVAGIADIRRFGPGWLARPMLNIGRADILQYATDLELRWIEDPSNADHRFDRNFLRHEVLPRLESRWPDIPSRLRRSASHAGDASRLLDDLAAIDLAALGGCAARLPVDKLSALPAARQRNVLRYALRDLRLATPTAVQLQRVLDEVILARLDAQPVVRWHGACVRRYRNGLYLLPENLAAAIESARLAGNELALGDGLGTLHFESGAQLGIAEDLFSDGLFIKARTGGEEFRPHGQAHTRKLKKLLQEEGVVPWMRDRLPLIYSGERLVAVGDLWLAEDALSRPGVAVHWNGRPALH